MNVPRPTLDAADRRTLGMLVVGLLLLTGGSVWLAWLLGVCVAVYHFSAGG